MADRSEWCGALLACARGNEVECNLPKGHKGKHEHIMADTNAFTKRDYGDKACVHGVRLNDNCPECPESSPGAEHRATLLGQLADEIERTIFFREIDVVETDIPMLKRQIANLVRSKAFESSPGVGATPQLAETIRAAAYDYWSSSKKHFGQTHMQDLLREKIAGLLRADVAATVETPPVQGLDGVCEFCGDHTNSYHGNPGLWPLRFCHPDGTGVTKVHHTKCVTERLFGAGVVATVETPLDWEEADTRKATPQKWDKVASELIDGLKLRGIQYNEDLCCEGTPWESVAEPEPRYFATFLEAYDFQIKLAGVAATVETPHGEHVFDYKSPIATHRQCRICQLSELYVHGTEADRQLGSVKYQSVDGDFIAKSVGETLQPASEPTVTLEEATAWRQVNWYDSVPQQLDEGLRAFAQSVLRRKRETER